MHFTAHIRGKPIHWLYISRIIPLNLWFNSHVVEEMLHVCHLHVIWDNLSVAVPCKWGSGHLVGILLSQGAENLHPLWVSWGAMPHMSGSRLECWASLEVGDGTPIHLLLKPNDVSTHCPLFQLREYSGRWIGWPHHQRRQCMLLRGCTAHDCSHMQVWWKIFSQLMSRDHFFSVWFSLATAQKCHQN